jgi:4-amino-4-deoxy-L-arabinose transferase-like glycosyltransferase
LKTLTAIHAASIDAPAPGLSSICNLKSEICNPLLLLLLVLCGFLFFHRLADRDLWSSHEGRAAQDAQTILDDGAWGLPRLFDRQVELQKPPLYYWLVATLARARGGAVDAWAVRLPAALAALGTVLLVWLLGRWEGRPVAGFVAAVILATAHHFTWLARVGRIDMPLTLAVTATLAAFYQAYRAPVRKLPWLLAGYLAIAVAVLLKGPVGVLLPAAVLVVFLLAERRLPLPWRGRRWLSLAHELGLWWGLPLVVALAVPWYLWAGAETNGRLFQVFFWHHNIERGLGGPDGWAAHPWWLYGPRLSFDLLPWTVLVPIAAWSFFRGGWREDAEARFGLIWLVTMVALLSCAAFKRADYLLPAYPGAALFLGCVAERWYRKARHPSRLVGAFGLVAVGCGIGWGVHLYHGLPRAEPALEYRRFAAAVRAYAPAPQPIIFFRVESHPLAFHLGRPIDTIKEWENIDTWAGRPGTYYIVMTPECARDWQRHVTSGRLEAILTNTDLAGTAHKQPLVLMRTRPRGLQISD